MQTEFTHRATLVRGKTYFLGKKKFEKGVPVDITEDEADYLRETAADPITAEGDGDIILRQKFKIEQRTGDDADEDAKPAARTRAAAPRR